MDAFRGFEDFEDLFEDFFSHWSILFGKELPAMGVDAIENVIGRFRKFQFLLCFIVFISKFFVAFNQMSILFLAPKMTYTCNGVIDACPCDEPIFDHSIFKRTIISEWNLICDRRYLIGLTQSLFQLGTLVGSIVFGMAADRYGRKNPLIAVSTLQFVTGLAIAYAPNYWSFTFLRFILGLAVGGGMVTSFVLLMEFIGADYRDLVSACYHIPFNLGHIMLPIFGYYIRDYENFQLAVTIPSSILLIYYVVLPETPRWLLTVKRTDDAIAILTRIAVMNKLPTENIRSEVLAYQVLLESHQLKRGTILDLFRTPNIRRNIICMAMNWLACSYCFYGVSQYVGHLSGNVFVNVGLSGIFALMGSVFSMPLMRMMGRRSMLISQNFIACGCLLVQALVPAEGTLSVVMAVIGVMSSFIVFVVVYLYCGEMFPTVVRNAAVGFSSMMARVGSMMAPFVINTREIGLWAPPLLFAVFPLIGGCLAFFLPETKGMQLMSTIEEAENLGTRPRT